MPFETDNALFTSEFDPSGLVKGAEAAANALIKVGTAQETVNATLAEGQSQMVKTTEVTAAMTKNIAEAEKTVKKFSDTANKPITPTINDKKINETLALIKTNFDKTLTGLHFEGFEELEKKLVDAKDDFEGLSIVIDEAKKKLAELKPNTKEFEDLNKIVSVGTELLKNYGKASEQTETKTKSLRGRIKELKDELTKLEDAGQENTEQFKKLQIEAARLTDQYGDMQQTIKILASDTKAFDFGLAAANAALSGFQLYTGVLTLFGVKSEDAAAIQTKLLAVMNLVQGAQQLQNLLLKESTLRVLGADLVTKAYTATQRILAVVLGTTTGATRALSAALLATGIGALVVGIGYLIAALSDWADNTDEVAAAQYRLKTSLDAVDKALDKNLDLAKNANNVQIAQAKARGATSKEIFDLQIDLLDKEISNLEVATNKKKLLFNQNHDNELLTIEERNNIAKEADDLDKQLEEKRRERVLAGLNFDVEQANKRRELLKKQNEDFAKALADALSLEEKIRLELALRNKTDEEKELIKLQREFDEQKAVLIKGRQSTNDLEKLYAAKRQDIIVKYGNLRVETERKLNDELLKISLDAEQRRVDNISNEFDREKAAIELEFKKSKEELQSQQTSLLNDLLTDKNNNLISPAEYEQLVNEANATFDKLFTQLENSITQKKEALAAKIFQNGLLGIQDLAGLQQGNVSNQASRQREEQANLFTAGKISFEQYQKAITAITQQETLSRLQIEKTELETQKALIVVRLALMKLSKDERDALIKQEAELTGQIQKTNEAIAAAGVTAKQQAKDNSFVTQFNAIAQSYNNLASSIANFYSKINQAQQQSLNREIAFQQTRVDSARIIAERGNAEYLELEQKRLDELERKRATAAQKQIAINNALVLSEATLAAISAISKATQEGSAIYAIAALAAVIGAIAAAYQFVNSLEPQSTQFYEGTPYVEQGPHKAGRDTIPARLNIGEAVIPTDKNARYKKAVDAIYYEKIPASVLNEFIDSYKVGANIPETDYNRLTLAVDNKGSLNLIETNRRLDAIYNVLTEVGEGLNSADNLHLTLDENGFALSIIKALKYKSLRSKL